MASQDSAAALHGCLTAAIDVLRRTMDSLDPARVEAAVAAVTAVAGAGTLLPVDLAGKVVGRYQNEADRENPLQSEYKDRGETLD